MSINSGIGSFLFKGSVYLDSIATNNPKLTVLDYEKQVNLPAVANPVNSAVSCPTGLTSISLFPNPSTILYIESDQDIFVRLSGSASDGFPVAANKFAFIMGSFTGLVVNNLGSTTANVRYFIGA